MRWKETEWKKKEFNSSIVKRFIVDLPEMNLSLLHKMTQRIKLLKKDSFCDSIYEISLIPFFSIFTEQSLNQI